MKCRTKQAEGSTPFSADGPLRGIRPDLHFLADLEPRTGLHMTPVPASQTHGPVREVWRSWG